MRFWRILLGFFLLETVILGCAREISPGRPNPSVFPSPGTSPSPVPTRPIPTKPTQAPPAGGSTAPEASVLTFEGPVEAAIPGGYQVAGHRVQVASELDSEGPLPPGVYVTVIGSRAPDGTVVAESFEVLRRPEAEGEWEGTILEILPNGYRVDGRRVFVLSTTAVIGTPQAGQHVYLSGFEQPDGSIVADSLIVLESP